MNEEWHEVDWVGYIDKMPENSESVIEHDDYDERNRGERTHWRDQK